MPYLDTTFLSDTLFWNALAPWAFCSVMLGCFILWTLAYLIPMQRTGRALARIAGRRFWTEETVDLDNRRMRAAESVAEVADTRLEEAFNQFKSQWMRHAQRLGGHQTSTVDIGDVVTEESLLPERVATWFAPSIPGFFTGTGILGTFVGLVLGLMGLGINDMGVTSAATGPGFIGSVLSLLAGMYTAFVTSIVGISLSLAWILLDGSFRGHMTQSLERFHQSVRAVYPTRAPADLLLTLVNGNAALRESFDHLGVEFTDRHTESLRQLSIHFLDGLGRASGEHLQALDAAATRMTAAQKQLALTISEMDGRAGPIKEALGGIADFAEALKARLEAVREGLTTSELLSRRAGEQLTASLDELSRQLASAQGKIQRASMETWREEIQKVSRQWTETLAETREAMSELQETLQWINENALKREPYSALSRDATV